MDQAWWDTAWCLAGGFRFLFCTSVLWQINYCVAICVAKKGVMSHDEPQSTFIYNIYFFSRLWNDWAKLLVTLVSRGFRLPGGNWNLHNFLGRGSNCSRRSGGSQFCHGSWASESDTAVPRSAARATRETSLQLAKIECGGTRRY